MITTTPRLTILMVAITVIGTGGPIAAFAQATSASSGDILAGQILNDVLFDNDVAQTSVTPQTNTLGDNDAVTVTQTNAPVQTQEEEEEEVWCFTQQTGTGSGEVITICYSNQDECERNATVRGLPQGTCERFEEPPPGCESIGVEELPCQVIESRPT